MRGIALRKRHLSYVSCQPTVLLSESASHNLPTLSFSRRRFLRTGGHATNMKIKSMQGHRFQRSEAEHGTTVFECRVKRHQPEGLDTVVPGARRVVLPKMATRHPGACNTPRASMT